MAQVPYSPTPSVQPYLQPTRPVYENTPEAAFGSAHAQALGLFGKTLDTVGNELSTRALAMQQLKNESDARLAGVQFSNDASQLYATFKEQYGANAGPEALAGYQKSLSDLREKYRGSLTNPMAQSQYDADSYNYLVRLNLYGAAHSAEQLKQYTMSTNKAAIEAGNNAIQLNPADEAGFKAGLNIVEKQTRQLASANGWSPEETEQQVAIAKSNATAGRIVAMARTDPQRATLVFGDAQKQGLLRGESIGKIQSFLDAQNQKIGSRKIADGIWDGTSMSMGKGLVSIDRAREAIASIESGGSYETMGPVFSHNGIQDQPLGRYQVLRSNLQDWLSKSGLPSMTPQEFVKNREAQDKVFDTIFGGYMQKYGNANDAASMWFTGKPMGQSSTADVVNGITPQGYMSNFNKALARTASLGEKQASARAQAHELSPNDPDVEDLAAAHVETRQAEDDRAEKQIQQERLGTITDAIEAQQGKGPMTLEAIEADPKVKEAVDGLNSKQRLDLQKALTTAANRDNTETDARTANFNRLQGSAYLTPDEFNGVNLYATDLTANQRAALRTMQKTTLTKGQIDDPQIKAVLKDPQLKDTLSGYGIDAKTDPDEYAKFTGALATEVNAIRGGGKTATPEQIKQIATNLLQVPPSEQGWLFNGHRLYAVPTPDSEKPKIAAMLKDKLGRDPSDQEIERMHTLMLYNQTIKAKANAK